MSASQKTMSPLGCFRIESLANCPAFEGKGAEEMADFWRREIARSPFIHHGKGHVVVVVLDKQLWIKGWHLVAMGGLDSCNVRVREILRPVLVAGGAAFVLMHNHPSGSTSPSEPDRELTQKVMKGAEAIGVTFTDHIIIGDGVDGYFSFLTNGLLNDVGEQGGTPQNVILGPWKNCHAGRAG